MLSPNVTAELQALNCNKRRKPTLGYILNVSLSVPRAPA